MKMTIGMKLLFLIIGFITTYFLYKNICSLKTKCPYKFNQFKLSTKTKLHFHHWLIHLIIMPLVFYITNTKFKYLYIGVNMGGIFHGIYTYKDWYVIIK
jgi:hypothetical protein